MEWREWTSTYEFVTGTTDLTEYESFLVCSFPLQSTMQEFPYILHANSFSDSHKVILLRKNTESKGTLRTQSNIYKPLTNFAKFCMLDVWLGSNTSLGSKDLLLRSLHDMFWGIAKKPRKK